MTFARVYVNQQIRRVPFPSDAIWYEKLNLFLEGCIFLHVLAINIFFHNLTWWRYESFKNLVSLGNRNVLRIYVALIFQNVHVFSKSNYERKNLLSKHSGKYTPSIAGSSFVSNDMPWHRNPLKMPRSWLLSLFTDSSKFTYTPLANDFISRPVVIYKL